MHGFRGGSDEIHFWRALSASPSPIRATLFAQHDGERSILHHAEDILASRDRTPRQRLRSRNPILAQSYFATAFRRPSRPISSASRGERMVIMASARLSTSDGGTRRPVRPLSTTVLTPGSVVAIVGLPEAMASSRVIPNTSPMLIEGRTVQIVLR